MSWDSDREALKLLSSVSWNVLSHRESYSAKTLSRNSSRLLDADQLELFSKLKFSYLEQETKEKFLRAILDDPPLVIEASNIETLHNGNHLSKMALKDGKANVDALLIQLQEKSHFICEHYEKLESSVDKADRLLLEISEMEQAIPVVNEEDGEHSSHRLPLSELLNALSEQQLQVRALESQIHGKEEEKIHTNRKLNTITHACRTFEENLEHEQKVAKEIVTSRATEGDRISAQRSLGRWYQRVKTIQEQLAHCASVGLAEIDHIIYVTLATELGEFKLALEFSENVFSAATCTTPCKIRYDDLLDVCRSRNDPSLFIEEFRMRCKSV